MVFRPKNFPTTEYSQERLRPDVVDHGLRVLRDALEELSEICKTPGGVPIWLYPDTRDQATLVLNDLVSQAWEHLSERVRVPKEQLAEFADADSALARLKRLRQFIRYRPVTYYEEKAAIELLLAYYTILNVYERIRPQKSDHLSKTISTKALKEIDALEARLNRFLLIYNEYRLPQIARREQATRAARASRGGSELRRLISYAQKQAGSRSLKEVLIILEQQGYRVNWQREQFTYDGHVVRKTVTFKRIKNLLLSKVILQSFSSQTLVPLTR